MIGKRNANGLLGCWPDSVAMYITFYLFLRYFYSVYFSNLTIKKQIKSKQEKKRKFTAEYIIMKLQIPKTRTFLKQPEGKWIGSPSK